VIFFFVVVLIGAYAMAASWAVCRGPRRLWSTASGALLLIVAGVVLLGWHYAVPSRSRLVLYAVALTGPIVFVPTVMLSLATATRTTWARALPTAALGACLGLACGYLIVVYWLRVW